MSGYTASEETLNEIKNQLVKTNELLENVIKSIMLGQGYESHD